MFSESPTSFLPHAARGEDEGGGSFEKTQLEKFARAAKTFNNSTTNLTKTLKANFPRLFVCFLIMGPVTLVTVKCVE